jgi:hypothetical protein
MGPTKQQKAAPQLRWLVAVFPPWWPGFEPTSGHVGFVVDKLALGHEKKPSN